MRWRAVFSTKWACTLNRKRQTRKARKKSSTPRRMANVSADRNYTVELNQTSTSTWLTGTVVFYSGLNIFLSITASLGNALILIALHRVTSIHLPTKLLLRCLAITDLCVGLISEPLFSIYLMSFIITGMNSDIVNYVTEVNTVSSFIFCEVSLFTSAAISVDRLLSILMGLRYRHVVTVQRIRGVLICFWLIGVCCAVVHLWDRSAAFTLFIALAIPALITSIFSFAKIYLKLRHHQLQLHVPQGQINGGGIPHNIARYKKSVSSVLWVQMTLVACYIPFIVVVMLTTFDQMLGMLPFSFTGTLTYLNSSLNPILYCWKIKTVRLAAKSTIKQLNCCKSG